MNQDPLDQLLQQQFDSELRDLASEQDVHQILRKIQQRERLRMIVFGIALVVAAAVSLVGALKALALLDPAAFIAGITPSPSFVLAALLAFIAPIVAWALDDAL